MNRISIKRPVLSRTVPSRGARLGVLCGALLLIAPDVAAQLATVQGGIHDEDAAAVYGATVSLFRADARLHVTDTDRLGSFRISEVLPGAYELRVEALGYAEYSAAIELGLGETLEVDILLEARAIQLEGIDIEAARSRERARFEDIGGPTVRELELEELRLVPAVGEPDPVRAIEVLPGVVSTSDFSAAFHVRGGSQDQNLILLDGVPVYSPFHLGGLFSVFNADMIDRVELQSGGFAAEHGGRVSSVLDIESDVGDRGFGVDAAVSLLATRVAVAGRLPDGVATALGQSSMRYRVSARRSYFDVLFKPAFEFPYHLTDLQAFVEGWTPSGDRLTFTGYLGKDVFDLTTLDSEEFPLRIDWDWGNDAVGVGWTRPRRGGGSLDVRANFSRFRTGLIFPDFADTDFRSRIQQAQVRVDLDTRPTVRWAFQLGASAQRTSYLNSFASGGTSFGSGRGAGWLVAGYAQTRWSRSREWLVELGLRVDGFRPEPGAPIAALSPRFALKRFLAGGDLALKLAGGRYTQFVHSLRDEELPVGLDVWILAGQRAPHTVSDQLQLGIEGYYDVDWFWSLETYVRSFDGVVTLNNADNPNDPLDDVLRGSGLSYGADLLLKKETGNVNGWLALSWLQADRTFLDQLSPLPEPPEITYPPIFDRRVDVDVVLRYPALWGWEGGVRWNFGTGLPYTRALGSYAYYAPRYVERGGLDWTGDDEDGDGGYGVVLSERNAHRYPTYHRLDLSFRRTFLKSWGSLTPYVNVVNVYNRRNVLFYFYQYEQDPAVRSGVSMFPVLPTVGLEVSF